MDKTKVTKDIENGTLVMERIFEAPRQIVWDAYVSKEQFEAWWGPEGWQTTTKEFNFRSGGRSHYGMRCIDESQGDLYGQESWGVMVFDNVDAPNSFTFKDYFADEEGNIDDTKPSTVSTYEFHDEDGATRLVTRTITETPEQMQELLDMGVVEGAISTIDRLERFVAE